MIARVASFLNKRPQVWHVLKIPKSNLGTVFYTYESRLDPITSNKRKDAETLKRTLLLATHPIKGDIIRREVTDEGYNVTYGR